MFEIAALLAGSEFEADREKIFFKFIFSQFILIYLGIISLNTMTD